MLSNFTPQLGEQIPPKPKTSKTNCSPSCGAGKRIAPQAKNVQNKLLPRLWSGKKNCSPGQKRAKQIAPQAEELIKQIR